MSTMSGFDNLSLAASRIRCRILDDVATVMVHQTYKTCRAYGEVGQGNQDGQDIEEHAAASRFTLPIFARARLTSISVRDMDGNCILESREEIEASDNNIDTDAVLSSFTVPVANNKIITVTLEYFVRLLNDAEMQWVLTLPEDIVPMKTERAQPVPDWDMPKVRNPESLYFREKTGNGTLGAAFSALPKTKPRLQTVDETLEEVEWNAQLKEEQEQKSKEESDETSVVVIENEKPKLEIFIEAFVSKGVSKLVVSGKALRTEVNSSGSAAETYLTSAQLNTYGPFTCTVHEAERALKAPVVWVQSIDQASYYKVSRDTSAQDNRQADCAGDLEILILIDCSDAMDGANMINIRRALKLFLNSLPTACHFNVYTFGTKWSRLFNQLVPNKTSYFRKARNSLPTIRGSMGFVSCDGILPVVSKIIKSAVLTKGKGRVIMISAANPTYHAIEELQPDLGEAWEHIDIPLYSVLIETNGEAKPGIIKKQIENISLVTSACAEYVTEPDLLDQALLRQLRRCIFGGIPAVSLIRDKAVPLVLKTDPNNPESFFGAVEGDNEKPEDTQLTVSVCDDICVDTSAAIISSQVQPRVIRPAAGDRLLQLATEDCCQRSSSMLVLRSSEGKELLTNADQVLQRYTKAAVPVSTSSKSRFGKWQRPWQKAVTNETGSDDEEDERDERDGRHERDGRDERDEGGKGTERHENDNAARDDSDSSDEESTHGDDVWEDSLPKRPISWSENFDLVAQRLTHAVECDGRVSWRLASLMLQMPKRPYKWANHDLWATVLAMTYLRLQNRTDDPCWDMYLDKAWQWLRDNCSNEGHRQWLFRRAIDVFKQVAK